MYNNLKEEIEKHERCDKPGEDLVSSIISSVTSVV